DANGALAGLLAVGVDVTDRRKAEAEQVRLQNLMREMAEEWRETFDTVQTPIAITDAAGVVTRVNRAARDLTGKAFRDIVGRPITDLDSGEPWHTANTLLRHMRHEDSGTTTETVDAMGRTWDISVERFRAGAEVPRFIVVLWEVTGIVELQKSLRRSE